MEEGKNEAEQLGDEIEKVTLRERFHQYALYTALKLHNPD